MIRVRPSATLVVALFSLVATTGCGGASLAPPVGAPASILAADRETASAPATAAAPLTITGFGGLRGSTWSAHVDGGTYDYAETVTVDFNESVNTKTFLAATTVSPAVPWSAYPLNYGKRVQLTLRETPGVRYTIAIGAGVQPSANGAPMASPAIFHFDTPAAVAIPAPLRSTRGEPYRYGILAHPFPSSLSGPTAAQQFAIIAQSGAGFVRIDYPAAQITPTATTVDFSHEDAIVATLVSSGTTELPILLQYSAAAWQNGGNPYPAIFASPQLFGQFAGTVAAHLRAVAPQITRIEVFNEPNLNGWWTSPNPQYAATDGSATAAYMLAAYGAIKAANPALTVVGPALADGGNAVDPRRFLTTMYASGCRTGTCWDVLSVHNYSWLDPTYAVNPAASNRWSIYTDLQAIAAAHGDGTPHVMLTEWAFSTIDALNGFDPNVQARFMALGFNRMLADPSVDGIVWTCAYAAGTDFWSRTALTNADFSALPALATFRAFTQR